MKNSEIRKIVKKGYAKIAAEGTSCCSGGSCCSGSTSVADISKNIGYEDNDLSAVPDGANLGLGCGNPVALASLKKGDTVLDLGSGAGLDAFLAARKVGDSGRVIGIDMTPEMIDKARKNSKTGNYKNVDFILGEIEDMPVPSDSVDVIISNCVINLSPEKKKVFREAMRVLKPGGRLMVSDVVLRKELPDAIRKSVEAYVGCISGAVLREDYIGYMKEAGFSKINIISETAFPIEDMAHDVTAQAIKDDPMLTPDKVADIAGSVVSIKISAEKAG